MVDFKELYLLAEKAGCAEVVESAQKEAESLEKQEVTKIVVTGIRNSGKTTFINKIVDCEVREPGNMDDEELPLRVNFEEMEEEDGIQCTLAVNREWNALSAVIYEFRQEDMRTGMELNRKMYGTDLVFFLISAMAPFRLEEIDYLKALAPLKRQVIVNGIGYVKEEERQKILDYITKVNESLGLPPVVVLKEGQNYGKTMRNLVPGYLEIKEQRKDRISGLYQSTIESLEKEIAKKIEEQEEASRQNEGRISDLSLEKMQKQTDCRTFKGDVAEYRERAVEKITKGVTSQLETMVRNVIKETEAVSSDTEIQKLAEKEYYRVAEAAVEKLKDAYMSDLEKVRAEVELLGIPEWDGIDWEELRGYAPTCDSEKTSMEEHLREARKEHFQREAQEVCFYGESKYNKTKLLHELSDAHAESNKILLGTGLVAGGFALASLPTVLSWAGGITAVGIGGISYMQKRKEEKEAVLMQGLRETFKTGISAIHTLVQENADFCYGKITEELQEKITEGLQKAEEGLKQEDAAEKEEIENLRELQKRCHALKEENKI